MGAATQGGISVSYPGQLCFRGRPRRKRVGGNQVSLRIGSVWKPLLVLKFNSQNHRNWTIVGLGDWGEKQGRRQKRLSLGAAVGLDFRAESSSYSRDTPPQKVTCPSGTRCVLSWMKGWGSKEISGALRPGLHLSAPSFTLSERGTHVRVENSSRSSLQRVEELSSQERAVFSISLLWTKKKVFLLCSGLCLFERPAALLLCIHIH